MKNAIVRLILFLLCFITPAFNMQAASFAATEAADAAREQVTWPGQLAAGQIATVVVQEGPGWRVTWLSGSPALAETRLCLQKQEKILICAPVKQGQYTGVIQAPSGIPVNNSYAVFLPAEENRI